MATVKGWSISAGASQAISYILDLKNSEEKTTGGYLVYSSDARNGPPQLASTTWKVWREKRRKKTGKEAKVKAYHFVQSFEPGSVTPEEVFDISKEWADKITEGKYPYVLAVHTDKPHLHSHILVHPYQNGTGKGWDIFWKNDLQHFRQISDAVCREHGLGVLPQQSPKSRSYYEWMADFNDTQQSTVKKVIEYLAPRSGSYQSFKDILRKLDFSVEDGSLDNNSKDGDPSVFSFTANRVLLDKERTTDTTYYLRIPKSQTYVQIPAAAVRWHRNKQTMKVTLPMEADFPAYRYGKESRVSVADLSEHFDKQMAQKKRSGLRIKPPGAQRYLKTKYMETANGQPLDLDSVKLMTSQGRLSPQMKKLLTTDSLKAIHEMRTEIYRQAGINTIPMNQPWKKRDAWLNYVGQRAENTWQRLEWERHMRTQMRSLPFLRDNRCQIAEEIRKLNQTIEDIQTCIGEMEIQMIESDSDTPEHIERYKKENLMPLEDARDKLIKELGPLDKEIRELERYEKYQENRKEEKAR